MSERTTIGGTVYESIGSSSSNLLLKCNGTARIQWGNKFIDLIKNGKVASSDSTPIFIISNESEIKADGIYILNSDKSSQLWVCKSGKHYNLINNELYVSASTQQDIPVEQQKQVLENIGLYYNTLDDVNNAGITNGLVYVLENKTLYTIKDGVVQEFTAMLKTDTDQQINKGDITAQSTFTKGMIIMYANTEEIPVGWAICDGNEHVFNGVSTKTPLIESTYNSVIFIMKL